MLRNALGDKWFLLSYSTGIRFKLRLGLSFMCLSDSVGM